MNRSHTLNILNRSHTLNHKSYLNITLTFKQANVVLHQSFLIQLASSTPEVCCLWSNRVFFLWRMQTSFSPIKCLWTKWFEGEALPQVRKYAFSVCVSVASTTWTLSRVDASEDSLSSEASPSYSCFSFSCSSFASNWLSSSPRIMNNSILIASRSNNS